VKEDKKQTEDVTQGVVAQAPVEARMLVLAGPGTGKTETVAKRLAHLLASGVKPGQFLVLSFSRSAVKTLTRRLEKHVEKAPEDLEELRHVAIRTFDSWTFRMLRLLGCTPGELLRESHDANIARLVEVLRSKEDSKRALEHLQRIRHIVVDEFQDLGGVRGALVLELLRLLCPPGKNGGGFTILGDEAQAIYGFARRNSESTEFADLSPSVLLKMIREGYPRELRTEELKTNHRATKKLAEVTHSLRAILSRDMPGEKKLDAMLKIIERIPAIDKELAADPDHGTAAVIARTNGEVIRAASKLSGKEVAPPAIPVIMRSPSQSDRVPAWIGATLGPMQGQSVTRSQFGKIYVHVFGGARQGEAVAMSVPLEQIAWDRLVRATGAERNATSVDLGLLRERLGWADLVPDDDSVTDTGIHVMTIHQSKGMEFSTVSVMEPGERKPPESDEEATEEACVMFVAVSRAGNSLKRVPAGSTYTPLRPWKFNHDSRTRWGSWHHGWINMEIGIDGDVNSSSFVDTEVHGSAAAVKSVQDTLGRKAILLRGHKVILCKHRLPGERIRFIYRIHLQKGKEPDLLLGEMNEQLTFDLLNRLHSNANRYPLPGRIYNLRISDVVTMSHDGEPASSIAAPWSQSGLWNGVQLYGTGDFMTRSGKK
jgi:superfamily I DNA/RNA helicase